MAVSIVASALVGMASCQVQQSKFDRVWFHNGHVEYVRIGRVVQRPFGQIVPDGTPMVCWVTNKPIGYEDLTGEGRIVEAE